MNPHKLPSLKRHRLRYTRLALSSLFATTLMALSGAAQSQISPFEANEDQAQQASQWSRMDKDRMIDTDAMKNRKY